MEYPFKDLMPLDEATARDGYYKDWTHIDADTFHQISELAKFIREKGRGSDTREAIAQALERVYHDAAISGNANMEVSQARGSYPTLAERLIADFNKLNYNKISKGNVEASDLMQSVLDIIDKKVAKGQVTMADLTQEVKEALTGGAVAVVGEGAVGTVNLLDKSVVYQKIGDKAVAIDKLSEPLQHAVGFKIDNATGANVGTSLYNWTLTSVDPSSNMNGEYYSLIPAIGSTNPKMIRTTDKQYLTGHKYYVRADVRITRRFFTKVELGIYPSGGSSVDKISVSYPHFNEWVTLDGIITANQSTGDLKVQLNPILDGTQTVENNGGIHIKNIVVSDLTEPFGAGKEPSLERYRDFVNSLGGHYIATTTREVANFGLNREVAIPSVMTKTTQLPVNPNRFDDEVLTLFSKDNPIISANPTGLIEWRNNHLRMQSFGEGVGQALIEKNLGDINLENYQYIEVEYYTDVPTKINNFAINIRSNGALYYGRNQKSKVVIDEKPGKRRVRMHLSELFDAKGQLTNASHLQFTFNGVGAKLELISIKAIKQSKGTVYMYFDDGDLTQYTNGFRIMEKYGLRGTIAVPTKWVGQSYGTGGKKVEWSHLREMQQAGWLVAGHGWDEKSLATLTDEEAYQNMKNMSDDLFSRGFYFGSKCMISPQGSFNANTLKLARKVGLHLVRTNGYPNAGFVGDFPQSNPHYQNYRSPTASRPVEEVKGWIDEAIATGKETAIAWHVISDTLQWEFANTTEYFEEIVQYAKQKQDEGLLRVVTWEDTMLQSKNSIPIDLNGNMFMSNINGEPVIVDLRN